LYSLNISPRARTQVIVALGGVNMFDEWGLALLHYAASQGHNKMIRFLLEKSARLNMPVTTTPESWKGSPKVDSPSRQWFSKVNNHTQSRSTNIDPHEHSGVGALKASP
jgi:ankyrin repeat protein